MSQSTIKQMFANKKNGKSSPAQDSIGNFSGVICAEYADNKRVNAVRILTIKIDIVNNVRTLFILFYHFLLASNKRFFSSSDKLP